MGVKYAGWGDLSRDRQVDLELNVFRKVSVRDASQFATDDENEMLDRLVARIAEHLCEQGGLP